MRSKLLIWRPLSDLWGSLFEDDKSEVMTYILYTHTFLCGLNGYLLHPDEAGTRKTLLYAYLDVCNKDMFNFWDGAERKLSVIVRIIQCTEKEGLAERGKLHRRGKIVTLYRGTRRKEKFLKKFLLSLFLCSCIL